MTGLCEESNLPVDFSVRLSEMSTKREGEGGNMRGYVRDRAAADVLLVPSRIGTVVPGSAGPRLIAACSIQHLRPRHMRAWGGSDACALKVEWKKRKIRRTHTQEEILRVLACGTCFRRGLGENLHYPETLRRTCRRAAASGEHSAQLASQQHRSCAWLRPQHQREPGTFPNPRTRSNTSHDMQALAVRKPDLAQRPGMETASRPSPCLT